MKVFKGKIIEIYRDISLHYKPSLGNVYSLTFRNGGESKGHNLEECLEFTNKFSTIAKALEDMPILTGNSMIDLGFHSNGGINSMISPVINIFASEQQFRRLTKQIISSVGVPDYVSTIVGHVNNEYKIIMDLVGKILNKHDSEIVLPEEIQPNKIYEIIKNVSKLKGDELRMLRLKYKYRQNSRIEYPSEEHL